MIQHILKHTHQSLLIVQIFIANTLIFEDTNIEKIVCDGQKYTPVYTNGRGIGKKARKYK